MVMARSAAAACVIALALAATATAGPAAADDDPEVAPVTIIINEGAIVDVEYGEDWSFSYTASPYRDFLPIPVVVATGTPKGWAPSHFTYSPDYGTIVGGINSSSAAAWLEPGTYSFLVKVDAYGYPFQFRGQSPPVTVTVAAAQLAVDARIVPDQSNGSNAIVSASLSGGFVDRYVQPQFNPRGVPSPAGTWDFVITSKDGTVADERSIPRVEGSDTFGASYYWDGAIPGESYSLAAAFTPDASLAKRFAVTAAESFDYTSPGELRVAEEASAQAPTPLTTVVGGFAVPAWWIGLIALAIAALLAFIVVFAIRLGRSSMPRSTTAVETAPGEGTS